MHSAGGRTLVGVIPFASAPYPQGQAVEMDLERFLGPAKTELLRTYLDNGVVTLGLHGYSHRDNSTIPGLSTEFRGMPPERQVQLMAVAQRAFQVRLGNRANVFIPPYNTYDEATLAASAANGISVLAAGGYVPLFEEPEVQILPGGIYPSRLAEAVRAALTHADADGIVFVTTHAYDFGADATELPDFRRNDSQYPIERFVGDIARLQATPGVRLCRSRIYWRSRRGFPGHALSPTCNFAPMRGTAIPPEVTSFATGWFPRFLAFSPRPACTIPKKARAQSIEGSGSRPVRSTVERWPYARSDFLLLCRRYPRHRDRASGWLLAAFVVAAVYGCIHLVFIGGYARTVIAITLCAGAAVGLGIDRVTPAGRRMAGSATEIAQR